MLVCIDTGIDGTIDERQGRWLKRVSADGRPEGPGDRKAAGRR